MEKKKFKDIKLSCLGMGNMRLPVIDDVVDNPIDYQRAQEIIDYAYSHGVNYYDTAYVYHQGTSEKFVGEALKKYPRDTYYVATKFNYGANPDYEAVFEEQLANLQTDCIDFYLLHALSDDSAKSYEECGCIEYFNKQKELGRIKYFGFSTHASVETLKHFVSLNDWDFVQIQLNYFDWMYNTAKAEYEVLAENNIPIMVMESIRGGRLSNLSDQANKMLLDKHPNWSISSWALRFLKTLPQVQVMLSGMSTLDQVKDNVATMSDNIALTEDEVELLFKACDEFKKALTIPCTGCRYCTDGCPMKINIPEFITVYNAYKMKGSSAIRKAKVNSEGKPSDCISCGACMNHCPQNINIPDIMKELASKGL